MDVLVFSLWLFLLWCSFHIYRSFFAKKAADGSAALPPGPRPLPIIGDLHSLGRFPHRSLHQLSLSYGPFLKLSLGQVTTVVVSSPSLPRDILQTHDSCFSNRFAIDTLSALNHDQLSMASMPISPLFKTLRKTYNTHMFSARKLDGNWQLRAEQVRCLIWDVGECAKNSRAVNISEASFRTTLNLLSNTVFSVNLANSGGSSISGELKEVMMNIMAEAGRPNISDYFPALKRWDPLGRKRRMEVYLRRIFDILDDIVEERTKVRSERGWRRKDDMLETLLDIYWDKNEEAIDNLQIKHMLLDIFIVGTDNTTSTLEWAMTELLRSPEKLSKAQSELYEVTDKGNLVEESNLPCLPYLQAVIKETFCLHPPAPFLVPQVAGEDKKVGGYMVPKGTQVLVNVWRMERDPSVWGNIVGEFIPERFIGDQVDVHGHHFELLPFGGGKM